MTKTLRRTRSNRIGVLAGVALSLCGVWNAQADVITQTQDINLTLTATLTASTANPSVVLGAILNKTLLFNEFDPSLGTLNEVQIDLTAAGTTSASFSVTTEGQLTSASFHISDTEKFVFGPLPGSSFSVTATFSPPFPFNASIQSVNDTQITFSTSHNTILGINLTDTLLGRIRSA
jgi:hypothetical protein